MCVVIKTIQTSPKLSGHLLYVLYSQIKSTSLVSSIVEYKYLHSDNSDVKPVYCTVSTKHVMRNLTGKSYLAGKCTADVDRHVLIVCIYGKVAPPEKSTMCTLFSQIKT